MHEFGKQGVIKNNHKNVEGMQHFLYILVQVNFFGKDKCSEVVFFLCILDNKLCDEDYTKSAVKHSSWCWRGGGN